MPAGDRIPRRLTRHDTISAGLGGFAVVVSTSTTAIAISGIGGIAFSRVPGRRGLLGLVLLVLLTGLLLEGTEVVSSSNNIE